MSRLLSDNHDPVYQLGMGYESHYPLIAVHDHDRRPDIESLASSRSIRYPTSSVSGVTTVVSWRAWVCAEHSVGSCPAATHCVTMSRSEIVPRKRRSLGLSTTGTTEMSLARINSATSALVAPAAATDRKSTRLNSSHSQISYAVFCLKK